jgi:SAM-dependent methyltransferase
MNPFSQALAAYHAGDHSAEFLIRRDDGFQQRVPASVFFEGTAFPILEAKSLDLCRGRVLDVGAAAGRHSLELSRRGLEVTSLDILPAMESILRERGIARLVIADVMQFTGAQADTVLMLMNGIGMVGTPDRLDGFLQHAHGLVAPGGQILCDSIDVSVTTDPIHVAYREQNVARGRQPGQQTFTMSYQGEAGAPFDWFHLDFQTLSEYARKTGWQAELLASEPNGHYLCRLIPL